MDRQSIVSFRTVIEVETGCPRLGAYRLGNIFTPQSAVG
jgi:hypothetical protein